MESDKVQEMQFLEQGLHNLILQKQAFQMELSETESALKEIEKTSEIYKILGQLMIKSDKNNIKKELENKKKLLEVRLKTIEKQESALSEKVDKLREEFMKNQKK